MIFCVFLIVLPIAAISIHSKLQMASAVGFFDDAPPSNRKRFFSVRVRHQKIQRQMPSGALNELKLQQLARDSRREKEGAAIKNTKSKFAKGKVGKWSIL